HSHPAPAPARAVQGALILLATCSSPLGHRCREAQGAAGGGCWSGTQASMLPLQRVDCHHAACGLTPPHASPLGRKRRGVRPATALCCQRESSPAQAPGFSQGALTCPCHGAAQRTTERAPIISPLATICRALPGAATPTTDAHGLQGVLSERNLGGGSVAA